MTELESLNRPFAIEIRSWIAQYRRLWEQCGQDFTRLPQGFDLPWLEFVNSWNHTDPATTISVLQDECEAQIARDVYDIVPRLVAIDLFRGLLSTNYQGSDAIFPIFNGWEESLPRIACLNSLRYLTSLAEPCVDRMAEPQIRWELANALISLNQELPNLLFKKLRQLDHTSKHEIDLLEGVFWFSFVYARRMDLNLTDGRLPSGIRFGDEWDPEISSWGWQLMVTGEALDGNLLRTVLWSTAVSSKAVPHLNEDEVIILERAVRFLSKGVRSHYCDVSESGGLLARALFDLGRYSESNKAFRRLMSAEPPCGYKEVRKFAQIAAAEASIADGNLDSAETMLKACHEEFPDATGVCLAIAEVQAKGGKYREAYDSLRTECEIDPSRGEQWQLSVLLALGGIAKSSDPVAAITERFKQTSPEQCKYSIQTLKTYWKCFAKLSSDSQTTWAAGHFVSYESLVAVDPRMRCEFEKIAAQSFVKVVEIELRGRVFLPFREMALSSPTLRKSFFDVKDQLFRNFLEKDGVLCLGDMKRVLLDLKSKHSPVYDALHRHVSSGFPELLNWDYLEGFASLNNVRRPLVHTHAEAPSELFEGECRAALEILVR